VLEHLRVALVHEWLISWGGSESVLLSLARLFPQAPIFTAVNKPDARVRETFSDRNIRPSLLQMIPQVKKLYRGTLPLMPWAFQRMDFSEFDLVISSSHAFAKSVRVPAGAIHLCYCHTPPRYLWDLYDTYNEGVLGALRGPILARLRHKDRKAARHVDKFVANSSYVAGRISRSYGRNSTVIYPPVDVDLFTLSDAKKEHYLAGGRLVRYKRFDRAIHAANRQGFPLVIFGDGPDRARLMRLAGPTVDFVGSVSAEQLARLIHRSRAFLFPGVEDFGILPVEIQAGGCPVIALAEGGALETVRHLKTGLLYKVDSVEGLLDAIHKFENTTFDPEACRNHALKFSRNRFEEEMANSISGVLNED